MTQKPFHTILLSLSCSIFMFGYAQRILEGPISVASGQDFTQMRNAMWNVLVTMSTVGYGDFTLKTNLGRTVGLMVCFWGTFLISFFVVSVNNMLTFEELQEKSYNTLQRLHISESLKVQAANVLTSAYRHKAAGGGLSSLADFRGKVLKFNHTKREIGNFYEGENEVDVLKKVIDNLREDVLTLRNDQTDMNGHILKITNYVQHSQRVHKTEAGSERTKSSEDISSQLKQDW